MANKNFIPINARHINREKYKNKEWLYKKYIEEELTGTDIGKIVGCNRHTITNWLKRFNIPTRNNSTSKLCKGYWNRVSGKNNPNWRGGSRRVSGWGYIRVYCPDRNNPRRDKGGRIAEQVLVVEKKIGRYLKPKEEIHHKNFKRGDNRIENLMVFQSQKKHLKFHSYLQRLGAYHLGLLKKEPKFNLKGVIDFK